MTTEVNKTHYDMLIIRCDDLNVAKYSQKVETLCCCVQPKKRLVIKSLKEKKLDKSLATTNKILFLLSSTSGDLHKDVERWFSAYPEFCRTSTFSCLVVHEVLSSQPFTYQFTDEVGELSSWKVVNVKSLADVFQWFPDVIQFLYDVITDADRKMTPGKRTSNSVTPSPREVLPPRDEQHLLKVNIDNLLARFHDRITARKFRADTEQIIAVAFGNDVTIPFYAYDRYRRAKINGGKVLFFFTTEVEFTPSIKDLSTHTFYPGQHMEGILLLICALFSMDYADHQRSPVLDTPKGSLMVDEEGIFWDRMEQLGNRSLSLQRREPESGQWTEIQSRLPLFKSSYKFRRSSVDATTEYRIVQEDESGQLSEPLYFTETPWQTLQRKGLAFLLVILFLPNIGLTLAFSPINVSLFIANKRQNAALKETTNLQRNTRIAVVIFWAHCSAAFILGSVAIILQHIYRSFYSFPFWFGLLVPFVLVCLNYTIRGQFTKYASRNLVTTTLPGFIIPPLDMCYVFWNNPFMSFAGNCVRRH